MAHGLLKFFRSVLLGLAVSTAAVQAGESIVVASTTSTEQSGLFNFILPIFEKDSGIAVRVVALGTGQALDVGRRGDADVVLVHDRPAEDKFVADGYGVDRRDVMYNDFVVIGPAADPAGVKRARDASDAFARIGSQGATWISRGDRSGTHAAELRFWKMTDTDANKGSSYKECGCGMGPALNIAAAANAYVLADRGTWLSFKNRGELAILVEGDKRLFNQYGVIVVNPAKHPHVKKDLAQVQILT